MDESVTRRKKRAITHTPDTSEAAGTGELQIVSSFVGQAVTPSNIFGVLFPNRSFPLDASNFNQVDSQRWLLDMDIFVGQLLVSCSSRLCISTFCLFNLSNVKLNDLRLLESYTCTPVAASGFQCARRGSKSAFVAHFAW